MDVVICDKTGNLSGECRGVDCGGREEEFLRVRDGQARRNARRMNDFGC